jgi:hypothetical protein
VSVRLEIQNSEYFQTLLLKNTSELFKQLQIEVRNMLADSDCLLYCHGLEGFINVTRSSSNQRSQLKILYETVYAKQHTEERKAIHVQVRLLMTTCLSYKSSSSLNSDIANSRTYLEQYKNKNGSFPFFYLCFLTFECIKRIMGLITQNTEVK